MSRSVSWKTPIATVLVVLALPITGCGGAMSDAMHAFDESRYPDAVAEFRALEPAARHWSPKKRTHYELYRGLTHLSCGDLREATHWLGSAKADSDRDPELLDEKERGRLIAAWRSMGLMPGEPVP